MDSNRSFTLRQYARSMRKHPTPGECVLWRCINAKQIHGITFRRQQVIGQRIVDFLAPRLKLVVEVDGGYHRLRGSADASRDRQLQRKGYFVLRLSEQSVLLQTADAVAAVARAVAERL